MEYIKTHYKDAIDNKTGELVNKAELTRGRDGGMGGAFCTLLEGSMYGVWC